ncbi:MAG: diguanylate cyclase [Alphaproteobacteria bacterium]|nr:diguanylate cyclase [Alphaproteobacteria bacterium]
MPTATPFEEELEARVVQCAACAGDSDARLSALVLVDLDGFKVVNDIAGHSAGDALLKQVADLLRTIEKVDMIARLGGDEFALVLSACTAEKSWPPARRSSARWTRRRSTGEAHAIPCAPASVSPCSTTRRSRRPRRASTMSSTGRTGLPARQGARRVAGGRLPPEGHGNPGAFRGDRQSSGGQDALLNGRFELYVMPIAPIDGVSGHYYEVLLRIVGSDGQMLAPAAFISAAERHQMMILVDKWVVRTCWSACVARLRTCS